MADAGIQVVLPVSWGGEFPDKAFRTPVLFGLVEANARLGVPLRIGMFDDTSSQMAEYGDYLDDGRVNGSSYQLTQTISLAAAGERLLLLRPQNQTLSSSLFHATSGRW
ncbi:MAG: hypothetical protein KatS3mg057_2672 [Herpetosiphonaceae bacterium]|nr:MAG: hypothetical protein KatS3mg057_2672 [Herpetosiphonaceae bacterium]